MKKQDATAGADKVSQALDFMHLRHVTGEGIVWITALAALALGAVISTVVMMSMGRPSALEAQAQMLRMCRKDPSFDRQGCWKLFKEVSQAKGKVGSGKGGGVGAAIASEGGSYKGQGTRLSQLSRNQALSINSGEDDE